MADQSARDDLRAAVTGRARTVGIQAHEAITWHRRRVQAMPIDGWWVTGRRGTVGRAAGAWQAGAPQARMRVSVTATRKGAGTGVGHGKEDRRTGGLAGAAGIARWYGRMLQLRLKRQERVRVADTARRACWKNKYFLSSLANYLISVSSSCKPDSMKGRIFAFSFDTSYTEVAGLSLKYNELPYIHTQYSNRL